MSTVISLSSARALYIEPAFNGRSISKATAFVARHPTGQDFLITNRHNVTGRNPETGECLNGNAAIPNQLKVSHNARTELGHFVEISYPLETAEGVPLWIEHPNHSGLDVVALPITEEDPSRFLPYSVSYQVSDPPGIAAADRVCVVGFPFGIKTARSFAVWATGYVASEPHIDHDGPTFLIDCRTREGQSGSPVIIPWTRGQSHVSRPIGYGPSFSDDELVGIYCGRVNKDADIGRVIKAYAIAELLDFAVVDRRGPA